MALQSGMFVSSGCSCVTCCYSSTRRDWRAHPYAYEKNKAAEQSIYLVATVHRRRAARENKSVSFRLKKCLWAETWRMDDSCRASHWKSLYTSWYFINQHWLYSLSVWAHLYHHTYQHAVNSLFSFHSSSLWHSVALIPKELALKIQ